MHVSGYRSNNCENLSIKYVQQSESAIKKSIPQFRGILKSPAFELFAFATMWLPTQNRIFMHFFIDSQAIFRVFSLKLFSTKHDQHSASFQSLPKINRMFITRLICVMKVYIASPSKFCSLKILLFLGPLKYSLVPK